MKVKKETLKIWYIFFYSILFVLIPWERIRSLSFTDRENYLEYAYYGINVLEFRDFNTIYSYVFNEWLWHFIIKNVGNYMPYEYFFTLVSFSIIFCMAYFLVRNTSIFSLIFLFNPLVVDLALSQYRISLAIVFISLALFFSNNKILRILFLFIAMLIHTSSVIFILIFIIIKIVGLFNWKKINPLYIYILIGFFLSFLMSGYLSSILQFFGDRRDYSDVSRITSSFVYTSFWLVVLIFLVLNNMSYFNKTNKLKTISYGYSLVVLSMVSANIIFGGYSTRFLAVSFPVIIKAISETQFKIKLIIFFLYSIYVGVQWWFWIG